MAIDNDANTAALGEALAGAGRGLSPVFYVTLGSGIGGGLVIDGTIYHGALPTEAEIGHIRLNQAGETLESRCSGWAVDRRLREYAAGNPASYLAKRLDDEGDEARHLSKAMKGALIRHLVSRGDETGHPELALKSLSDFEHPQGYEFRGDMINKSENVTELIFLKKN